MAFRRRAELVEHVVGHLVDPGAASLPQFPDGEQEFSAGEGRADSVAAAVAARLARGSSSLDLDGVIRGLVFWETGDPRVGLTEELRLLSVSDGWSRRL